MKIVSIDFDILMHQDLIIYNDAIKYGWHNLLNSPSMQVLRINLNLFCTLTLWLLDQIKKMKQTQIFFIKDHSSIYNIFEIQQIKQCDLYNIDFHHDLGYGSNPFEEPLNCGNWVLKLLQKNKLKTYTWLNTQESAPSYHQINFANCKYKQKNIIANDFKLIELENPDYLIICLSPEWVPPYYQNLFFLWMDLIAQHYGNKFELF